jgi:hypothetical protein
MPLVIGRGALLLLTLLGLALPASRASAELVLRWQAPPECPQQRDAERAIARELEGETRTGTLRAEVVLERVDREHWRARLRLHGALEAERDLEGDACSALADTSAWLIADALRSLPPLAAKPSDPVLPWELGLGLRFDSGTLPHAAPGLGLRLARAFGALRVALEPRVLSPNELVLPAAISGSVFSAQLALSGCYVFALAGVALGPCVGVVPGMLWAHTRGFANARSASGPSLAVEAAAAVSFAISARFDVRVELGAARPIWFPRFTLAPIGVVHQPDPVIAHGSAGMVLRF